MTAPHIVPVVLSGGSGTRLWPLSTEARPKQFHALTGARSMIQETVLRMPGSRRAAAGPPIVIGAARHREAVHAQLGAAGVRPSTVVLEPVGRNTAPAAVIAALLVRAADPDALALLAPADHLVGDPRGFWAAVEAGAAAARARIVTFGVQPSEPATGYGYIRRGAALEGGVFQVERFCEKPDRATAETYVADGRHYWNAGIFLFSPAVLLEEMRTHRPDVLAHASAALERGERDGADVLLDPEAFARCPDVSIDYAVMEPSSRSAVVPCDIGWADLGSWAELWRHGRRDADGNHVRGEAATHEAEDCLVWSDGPPVTVIGARDLVVVATAEGVLVVPRDRAQDVKLGLERLKAVQAALSAAESAAAQAS